MLKKFVKDRQHNRYPAYCCEDIDERLGVLEAAVQALVAQTVPDGAVTLAKLADDARTYTREINKGTLFAEWIGTEEEYKAHIEENDGQPLTNVRYTITESTSLPVGSLVVVCDYSNKVVNIGETRDIYAKHSDGVVSAYEAFFTDKSGTCQKISGTWASCGTAVTNEATFTIMRRIA